MPDLRRPLAALAPYRWVLEPALALVLFAAWFVWGLPFEMAATLAWVFYAAAVALWALAFWLLRPDWVALLALGPAALQLGWQVATLESDDGDNALARFRANRFAGLLMALACWAVGNA